MKQASLALALACAPLAACAQGSADNTSSLGETSGSVGGSSAGSVGGSSAGSVGGLLGGPSGGSFGGSSGGSAGDLFGSTSSGGASASGLPIMGAPSPSSGGSYSGAGPSDAGVPGAATTANMGATDAGGSSSSCSPGSGNGGNLALMRPVTVSSTESENGGVNVASKAVDGDYTTRWSSEWNIDPSWIYVDLGADQCVNQVKVTWEWSYAKEYQIQVSDDAVNWTTTYSGSNSFSGDDGVTDVTFTAAAGRYLRLFCTQRATTYGYSLYELEVYGGAVEAASEVSDSEAPPFDAGVSVSVDATTANAGATEAGALGAAVEAASDALPYSGGSTTTVTLTETSEAFPNPMMGFRPSVYIGSSFEPHEYTSTYKQYIPYTDLEASASDTVQTIIDWSNANWAGLPAQNLKVIPRVVIDYPGTGEYWGDIPNDGTPDAWVSSALQSRLVAFTAKIGQAWDHDPRVAAVEMGLWGYWGEHNIYPQTCDGAVDGNRIPPAMQAALAPAFIAAFPDKKVMIRYPDTFTDYTTLGFYWDSFALPDDNNAGGGQGIVARNLWQTQMESGEVAYNWGDQSNLGGSPDGTLSSDSDTQYVIGFIQSVHTSSLGWIAEYTPDNGVISANAALMQKAFGYRYVISQATFDTAIAEGGALDVDFTVQNVANAPFYYAWPVGVFLLNTSQSVVWSGTLSSVDIRQWMPGNSYNVQGSVTPNVPTGVYTLALSILDPAGNTPSLRFANTNYLRGGYTPLGNVGVGQGAPSQNLPPFASLYFDHTLGYSMQ
jgi:hypothetical protein